MIPDQRGERDEEERALHGQPDLGETAVLMYGHKVQIFRYGACILAAGLLAEHLNVHQIVVIIDRL